MNRGTPQGRLRAFDELRGTAKAITETGTGVAFCAGMDLKEREADRAQGIEGAEAGIGCPEMGFSTYPGMTGANLRFAWLRGVRRAQWRDPRRPLGRMDEWRLWAVGVTPWP